MLRGVKVRLPSLNLRHDFCAGLHLPEPDVGRGQLLPFHRHRYRTMRRCLVPIPRRPRLHPSARPGSRRFYLRLHARHLFPCVQLLRLRMDLRPTLQRQPPRIRVFSILPRPFRQLRKLPRLFRQQFSLEHSFNNNYNMLRFYHIQTKLREIHASSTGDIKNEERKKNCQDVIDGLFGDVYHLPAIECDRFVPEVYTREPEQLPPVH